MKKERISSDAKQQIVGWTCGVLALVMWFLCSPVPENSSLHTKECGHKPVLTDAVEQVKK